MMFDLRDARVINQGSSRERTRMVLLHELGHIQINRSRSGQSKAGEIRQQVAVRMVIPTPNCLVNLPTSRVWATWLPRIFLYQAT